MKAFVTGGTGFIGQHVVGQLLERGYEVHALAHSEQSAAELSSRGAAVSYGDIGDQDSMWEGMSGSDVVFHAAGWYKIGSQEWMKAERINVAGTRNVLRLAVELGVPRIVYVSTTAVFGDTRGEIVDETFFQGGPFVTEYDRTKWLAHYKVAVPLIEQGAPVIIGMPGGVYGPGDHSLIGTLMERFYLGKMPAIPGPEFGYTYAHVEDIAEGLILAAEKGKPGESYILTGPAVPLGEVIDFWGQLIGKRPPVIRIPARFLVPMAPLFDSLSNIFPLPEIYSSEAARILGVSYMGRSDKARAELGWRTRSMQEGMSQTFNWIADTSPPPEPEVRVRERRLAGLALLSAAILLFLWLLDRNRD